MALDDSFKIPFPNTSAVRKSLMKVINVFALVVVAESYSLARGIPTPSRPHSLNTFQVSGYQNFAGITIAGCAIAQKGEALIFSAADAGIHA